MNDNSTNYFMWAGSDTLRAAASLVVNDGQPEHNLIHAMSIELGNMRDEVNYCHDRMDKVWAEREELEKRLYNLEYARGPEPDDAVSPDDSLWLACKDDLYHEAVLAGAREIAKTRKILAIKIVRRVKNIGLKDAKEIVDNWLKEDVGE